MTTARAARLMIATTLCAGLAACGGAGDNSKVDHHEADMRPELRRSTIWDLFNNDENPNYSVAVNKYLWNASLEVLDFLPVQAVDPFTGVITTGYGTPPGGGTAYRATILVSDPALDARSLNVALMTRSALPARRRCTRWKMRS